MADLYSYALCTVADVKEILGIASGDSSKNNLITRKINQATDMLEGWALLPIDHHFKETTYTNEVYDSTNSDNLMLNMWPVSSVSSFGYRDNSLNEDSWTTFDTSDYFTDSDTGTLLTNFNLWGGWGGFRVTYTAGFDPIPSDLAEACATLAAYLVNNSTAGQSIASVREGQRQVTYNVQANDKSLIEQLGLDETLNRYRRVTLGAS